MQVTHGYSLVAPVKISRIQNSNISVYIDYRELINQAHDPPVQPCSKTYKQ